MTKRNLITVPVDAEAKLYFKELKNKVIAYYFELSGVSMESSSSKILVQKSGLCSAKEFDLLQDCPEDIIEFETQDLKGYFLWSKDIKEFVRVGINNKNPRNGVNKGYKKYIIPIEDIFSNKNFQNEDIIVGKFDYNREYFYEYGSDIPYIRLVYFDFFNGVVTDEHYDLEEIVKILSKRKDIIWRYKDPIQNFDKEFNFLVFWWNPTEEDWERFVKSDCFKKYHYYRYEWILKNILELRRKKDERK